MEFCKGELSDSQPTSKMEYIKIPPRRRLLASPTVKRLVINNCRRGLQPSTKWRFLKPVSFSVFVCENKADRFGVVNKKNMAIQIKFDDAKTAEEFAEFLRNENKQGLRITQAHKAAEKGALASPELLEVIELASNPAFWTATSVFVQRAFALFSKHRLESKRIACEEFKLKTERQIAQFKLEEASHDQEKARASEERIKLAELALREKISIEGDYIRLKDSSTVKEVALNKAIDILESSSKSIKIKDLINTLAKKAGELKQDTLQRLMNKGILKKEEHKILWIIPNNKYPTSDLSPENKVTAL